MKTPWEKYIEDIDNKPDAEFIAWQKWIVENDTDDAIEHVEFMAEIFFYGMFLKTVEYLYNSMKVGDFRTVPRLSL